MHRTLAIPLSPPAQLKARWAFFALLCALTLVSGYTFLASTWETGYALRWLLLAGATSTYLLIVLWRGLPFNYRQGEGKLLPTLGWGNRMTLLRGMILAALVGFLTSPRPEGWLAWIPGILYTLADTADYLDGYLARRTNHVTRLGEILDMRIDGFGVLAAALLAIGYGQVPAWYLVVGLARYLYLGGLWLQKRLDKPVYELPPSISRRGFAGLQMGFLAVMLWPLFSPPGTHIAAALFALPFLAGFARDWLIVSGIIQPESEMPENWREFVKRWLPVTLRVAVIAISLSLLIRHMRVAQASDTSQLALGIASALVGLLLFLGFAGRTVSILGLLILGFQQMHTSLNGGQIVLAALYTAILFMGSGALSLWAPEDHLIYRRAGESALLRAKQSA